MKITSRKITSHKITARRIAARRIAAITDDGKTISQHFGRASHYLVVTVEDGEIVGHELRDKLGHSHFAAEHEGATEHHDHGEGHGLDPASHDKHASMAESIADCQTLLCRGMGMGAYVSMQKLGIQPVVTDISSIDEAVQAYVRGELVDHTEKLH